MISGHRLVVVTPAGRRRYLEILAQHVLACPEVDEWHLWQNTTDAADSDVGRFRVLITTGSTWTSPSPMRVVRSGVSKFGRVGVGAGTDRSPRFGRGRGMIRSYSCTFAGDKPSEKRVRDAWADRKSFEPYFS